MQVLQQAITDHEPELVSLQRELEDLSLGPVIEPAFYDRLSQDLQCSSGRDEVRPGKEKQESTLKDYEERMNALKRTLNFKTEELASKLEQSSQFKDSLAGLLSWMDKTASRLDELVIRDPARVVIEEQHSKCKVRLDIF